MTNDTAASSAPPRVRALLAAMIFAALAPITAWLAWETWHEVRTQDERTHYELQQAASGFAQSVERELSSSIDALTVLSQSELFQQGRIAAMGRLLQGRPRRDWDSIFLLDAKGAVVLDTAAHPSAPEPLVALHGAALLKLAPVVSGAKGAPAAPGIAIAMPIMQASHVRYVLGVRLSDSVWPRLAANATLPDGAQAQLFDSRGRAISGSDEPAAERAYDAWEIVPVAGWRVRVAVPAMPIDEARRAYIVHALSTSGVALLAGIVLATLFAITLVRRLHR